MYYVEEIRIEQAAGLLQSCGLSVPEGVSCTAGVFREDGKLAACGSLKGDMIQGVAVDPAFQGEDLTAKVVTWLIGKAGAEDIRCLYLFTKPEKAGQFAGLGFRPVVSARPYAAMLEWGESGIRQYMEKLSAFRKKTTDGGKPVGGLVMNCNPFTLGHRFLVEEAAEACSHVFILVVEEDVSLFPFRDRLAMVKAGTADLDNVTVLAGGRYAVSALTFPSYFTKEENLASAHGAVDAELYAACIAPSLGITMRFVGTEPLSPVTDIYNQMLKERLPRAGIGVTEIQRREQDGEVISASRVRAVLLEEYRREGESLSGLGESSALQTLRHLVPETTLCHILKLEEEKVRLTIKCQDRNDGRG